jgi:CrcB protein
VVDEGHQVPRLRLWPSLAAVAAGGAIGTLVRAELMALERPGSLRATLGSDTRSWWPLVPWWLIAINTVGVFVATVALRGPLRGRSPEDPWRLFVVTGLLGGLTSYSSLIRGLAVIRIESTVGAVVVAVGAMVAGVGAAGLGEAIGRRRWP